MNRTSKGIVIAVALLWVGTGAALITEGVERRPPATTAETSSTGSQLIIPATGNPALAAVPAWPSTPAPGVALGSSTARVAVTVAPKIKPTPKRATTSKPRAVKTRRVTTSARPTSFTNCTELRKVYPNGVPQGHPAYRSGMDRDHDGRACEK